MENSDGPTLAQYVETRLNLLTEARKETAAAFHVSGNAGAVVLDTDDFGTPDAGPSAGNVLSGTGKVHMAMVRPAGGSGQTLEFFIAGARVFTFVETAQRTGNTTVSVGKIAAGSGQACHVAMDDIRLTKRALYTGTSFTPPGSPL